MRYLFANLREVEEKVRQSDRVYLMLDYDGTITPIARYPRLAKLPNSNRRILRLLAAQPRCFVAIISGRRSIDVKHLVGLRGIYYIGNHGLEISGPKVTFVHSKAVALGPTLLRLSRVLESRLKGFSGVLVENKGLSISVHYRMLQPTYVPALLQIVRTTAQSSRALKVGFGKKVVEIRPLVHWNKGTAAEWLISSLGEGLPVYAGDDQTDEDAFLSLKRGVTILVSDTWKRSRAKYYVRGATEVRLFLRVMLNTLSRQNAAKFRAPRAPPPRPNLFRT
jgi:trehalose 6-phosphate phosphatase